MTEKPKTLKQLKQEASSWRVVEFIVKGPYPTYDPIEPRLHDERFYMNEGSMRSLSANWRYFAGMDSYDVHVYKRNAVGDWEEIPNYDWD